MLIYRACFLFIFLSVSFITVFTFLRARRQPAARRCRARARCARTARGGKSSCATRCSARFRVDKRGVAHAARVAFRAKINAPTSFKGARGSERYAVAIAPGAWPAGYGRAAQDAARSASAATARAGKQRLPLPYRVDFASSSLVTHIFPAALCSLSLLKDTPRECIC